MKRVLQEADIEALTAQTPFFVARREDRVFERVPPAVLHAEKA